MNQLVSKTRTQLGGEVIIHDFGNISKTAEIGPFGPYLNQIQDYLTEDQDLLVNSQKLRVTLDYIKNIALFQSRDMLGIHGVSSLRHLQNLTLAGYVNFLLWNLEGQGKTGKLILPTGQGKTLITSLLAYLDPKKSIVIVENNNGKSQFLKETSRIQGLISNELSKESQNTSHLVVGLWGEFVNALQNNMLDLSQYSTIYIDEADVNGLSEKRQNTLKDIIEKFDLKVVGISATEKQASGKQLDDFYEYDVLSFPMPESFPALYKLGELPDISFKDVLLSANLQLSSKLIRDTDNPEFELFIRNSDWIGQILNYHLEYNKGKKIILGMRNNKLNEFIIKVAESKGIKLIGLTGDDSQEERENIIQLLQMGKIDGIIGSRLTGRGLNIPECQVVYNSLITSSPQLFWQLGGRAARFDGGENKKEIITFLPKDIQQDTEKKGLTVPLCFQAFFQTDFFSKKDGNMSIKDDVFDLKSLQEEQIMSSDRVNSFLEMINKYGSFDGKPEILAKLILSLSGKISYNALVKYLGSVTGANMEDFYSIHEDISKSEDPYKQDLFKKYNKISKNYNISYGLDIEQEKKLISQYFGASDEKHKQKYLEKLLSYHYPIVIALACKMSQDEEQIYDLVQDGIEGIIKRIDNYKPIGRFSTFCKIQAFSEMNRSSQRLVAIPVNIEEILKKVHKILNREEGLGNQSRNEIEKKIMDELQISQKKVQKLLEYIHPEFEGVEQLESLFESPEDYVATQDFNKNILKVLDELTAREKLILKQRFGIGFDFEFTLDQVGEKFGVTAQMIRAIEAKALRKLRHPSRTKILEEFLEENGRLEDLYYQKYDTVFEEEEIPQYALDSEESWRKFALQFNRRLKKRLPENRKDFLGDLDGVAIEKIKRKLYGYSIDEIKQLGILQKNILDQDLYQEFAKNINKKNPYKYLPENLDDFLHYIRNGQDLFGYSDDEIRELHILPENLRNYVGWKEFVQKVNLVNKENTEKILYDTEYCFERVKSILCNFPRFSFRRNKEISFDFLEDEVKWRDFAISYNKEYKGKFFLYPDLKVIEVIFGITTLQEKKHLFFGVGLEDMKSFFSEYPSMFESDKKWQEFVDKIKKKYNNLYLFFPDTIADFKKVWKISGSSDVELKDFFSR